MRRWHGLSACMVLVFVTACVSKEPERESLGPAGMPAFFPETGLLLEGDPDLVLAEGDHGIRLTLAEYNGRAFDEKLPADLDTLGARRRYLGSLIDYKVAAVEAKKRGFVAKDAETSVAQERELAQQVLQQSILAAANIPDEQAIAFVKANPERFGGKSEIDPADHGSMQHIKYLIQDQKFRAQLDAWREREQVLIHWDRMPQLQPTGSNDSMDSSSEESQS